MVYTLTLNPAIDYVLYAPDYTSGKINRSNAEELLPGGKGINVSLVLKSLGAETKALGFCGGETGYVLLNLLKKEGLDTDFVRVNGSTRINVKIKSLCETDINASGPDITTADVDKLLEQISRIDDGDWLVLAGSAAPGLSTHIYCDILEKIKHKNINIVVDAAKDLLTNTLKYRPYLIKPNNFELSDIVGKNLETDEEITDGARKLRKMGARNVLVSLGEGGTILVCENGDVIKTDAPSGAVVNTTGAGDSAVAGFIFGMIEKNDISYAQKISVCAGSATAFSQGLATSEEIMDLYNKNFSEGI